MSNELKLEKLSDLLDIDTDGLKSPEKTRLLTAIKQLIKEEGSPEEIKEAEASEFPYTGVSIVGNKYVELKFDLKTKAARVVTIDTDPRDTKGKNIMVSARAMDKVKRLHKGQKEV